MAVKVAVNGFGRIGRNIVRALYESGYRSEIELVAINDVAGSAKGHAHLFKYDSIHGQFPDQVEAKESTLIICGDEIPVYSETEVANLPWETLGVDIVFECSGRMTHADKAKAHLDAGSSKVLISAPGQEVDATIVYGVNDHILSSDMKIVSNASCTTNCLAPVAQVLEQSFGIESGLMTTIHSYTNDQKLLDASSNDLYRARSATQSMIPTRTGAAAALGLVLPELAGKLDGLAVRVPTANVSLVDLSVVLKTAVDVDLVNQTLKEAAAASKVLGYNDEPLVSCDFNHNPASSVFDASQTRVQEGTLLKVMSWYDNEWGFSNRMLDTAIAWNKAS